MFDSAGLEVLDRQECLRLLSNVRIGRVAFTARALPAIQPVSFVLDRASVIIRARPGSELAAAASNAVVAFEADDIDPDRHRGWIITAVGRAEHVTARADLARIRRLPLHYPRARGRHDHIIRIHIHQLTGRRLPGDGLPD